MLDNLLQEMLTLLSLCPVEKQQGLILVILALGRLKREDREFEATPGYIVETCFKKQIVVSGVPNAPVEQAEDSNPSDRCSCQLTVCSNNI